MAAARIFVLTLGIFVTCVPAQGEEVAISDFRMLHAIKQSTTVFVCNTTEIEDRTAKVNVTAVLLGNLKAGHHQVVPCYFNEGGIRHCLFSIGKTTIVFGHQQAEGSIRPLNFWEGAIQPTGDLLALEIAAIKWLVAISQLPEHEQNLAMLAAVRDDNIRVRHESQQYVASHIAHSKERVKYRAELVALLEDREPSIQRAGLAGLQFIPASAAVKRMICLTRSPDHGVASAASMALSQYDTADTTTALIALTKHDHHALRSRAAIDLTSSRRPEAKKALIHLLADEHPAVRSVAPGRFVYWLQQGEADEVLPRLVELLDDKELEVRKAVAYTLGESKSPTAVLPLFSALKQNPLSDELELSVCRALATIYSKGNAEARLLVDANINVMIATLMVGGPHDAWGPSRYALNILRQSPIKEAQAAVIWASQAHSSKAIRAVALEHLSK